MSENTQAFRIAQRQDVPLILRFIRELAKYEEMLPEVVATEELLEKWLFDRHAAEVLFSLEGEKEVGFALYFYNFSTFLGRAGIYLEDLFVLPEYRGRGHGKGLLRELARNARRRGLGRVEWWCLDWNRPSVEFYRSLGAQAMEDWTVYRLSGPALEDLAGEVSASPNEGLGRMLANEYQELAARTVNPDLNSRELLINGVMGLCGEAGEAIDLVKKHLAQGHALDREHLARELGDVAWYLAETATAIGYSLEEILSMNIEKLRARYPEGFRREKSLQRDPKDL